MRIFRKLAQMLDVEISNPQDDERLIYDSGTGKWVNGTPAGASGAPDDATYIVQTAHADLSAEQPLSALATGLVKVTNGTGVLSTATGGTDYANASHVHAGEDITSGTVADARIASTIARDSEVTAAVAAHVDDTSAAHAASAISFSPTGNLAATDAQAAIEEAATDAASALSTHEADTTSVHGITDTSALALTANVVTKSLYDANTVLAATSDDTPAAITMGASTILARLAAGNIKAASVSEIRTLLDVPTNAEAILDTLVDAKGDLLVGSAADTVARLAVGATNGQVLEVASGASNGVQWDLPSGWQFDYAEKTSNTTISATTEGAADTIVTGAAVTYDGSTDVWIEFQCTNIQVGANASVTVCLFEDGSAVGNLWLASGVGTSWNAPCSRGIKRTPASGSRTYSIRAFRATANGTVAGGAGGSGTAFPASLRITKI